MTKDLQARRIVPIAAVAQTLGISKQRLFDLMAETDTPMLDLGDKVQGMFLEHLDDLLDCPASPSSRARRLKRR
jgi:phage-related minor tail protein